MDEEASSVKRSAHLVGMALDSLSVDELKERIGLLGDEILRLEKEIEKKIATLSSAQNAFKL